MTEQHARRWHGEAGNEDPVNAEDDLHYRDGQSSRRAGAPGPLRRAATPSRDAALGFSLPRCADTAVHSRVHSVLFEKHCFVQLLLPLARAAVLRDDAAPRSSVTSRSARSVRRTSQSGAGCVQPGEYKRDALRFFEGADQSRLYACKYAGKPEPWFYMETTGGEANPVKRFLQRRRVGMPMCYGRMLGFHVVRSTVPTLHFWPQFTVAKKARIERNPMHKQMLASYPDPQY